MTITEKSRDFSKIEIYKMTKANDTISVKDLPDGAKLHVDGYLTYDDINGKGEEVHMLSVVGTMDGVDKPVVWTCQSATFKTSFFDIWAIFNGGDGLEPFTIVKGSGQSKLGRDFVECGVE